MKAEELAPEKRRPYIHINRPRYSDYFVHWRRRGHRKSQLVARCKTEKAALKALHKFLADGGAYEWKCATVSAYQEWYGFTRLYEVRR